MTEKGQLFFVIYINKEEDIMFKKFAIVLVALLAFGGTVSAYAWWDQLDQSAADQTLTIGVRSNLGLTVNASAEMGKTLVPDEALLGVNDVKSYTFTYTLVLDKQLAVNGNLEAVVSNIEVGGVPNPSNAISVLVSYDTQAINADSAVTVTLTVTMANPTDEAHYNLLANQNIIFDVDFTVN